MKKVLFEYEFIQNCAVAQIPKWCLAPEESATPVVGLAGREGGYPAKQWASIGAGRARVEFAWEGFILKQVLLVRRLWRDCVPRPSHNLSPPCSHVVHT